MGRGTDKPLYRKVNTRTHGVRHGNGGKARWDRGKDPARNKNAQSDSMHSHHQHGRDYTPLFKFLISKVGQPWNDVHSAAVARLDKDEPIFWMVALQKRDEQPFVHIGESSYFSGLCIDKNGNLAKVDPDLDENNLEPFCPCCTHTFNGARFTRSFGASD